MGFWDGLQLQWNFTWRRRLFQWETHQFGDMLNCLSDVILAQDKPWRSYESKEVYTVKSFSKAIWNQHPITSNVRSFQFSLAPPRAELVTWFVLLQWLNTRSRLKRFNLIKNNDEICPFVAMKGKL